MSMNDQLVVVIGINIAEFYNLKLKEYKKSANEALLGI